MSKEMGQIQRLLLLLDLQKELINEEYYRLGLVHLGSLRAEVETQIYNERFLLSKDGIYVGEEGE